jgi:hypothetical protein
MSNYRSISLLTTVIKVLEEVRHSRLRYNLQASNKLVSEQFGFRKVISTENTHLKLTDSVLKSVNQNMHVGIFCDLAKKILLCK